VTLNTAEQLPLPDSPLPACLAVELVNGSSGPLTPGPADTLVFSFRLLDGEGNPLPHEGIRTPLEADVPPGGCHRQKILVDVPPALRHRAAAVRVGMLSPGRYWVEQFCPDHPRTVQLAPDDGPPPDPRMPLVPDAIWPLGPKNGLPWPFGAYMVSERHRLLYIPIAKCACTSLKSMMVKLAGITQPKTAIRLDVHRVTDRFNTGALLKDKPIERARAILAAEDYTKFTVMRDPLERLVSAYLEKFVYNRRQRQNQLHIRPVLRAIRGGENVAPDPGISFREFVTYILAQDPYDLDPHWRPQHLYFISVPHLTRIFRLENIDALPPFLQQAIGQPVTLAHRNRTRRSDRSVAGAADLTAEELEALGAIDPTSLLAPELEAAIREGYREDLEYYAAAG